MIASKNKTTGNLFLSWILRGFLIVVAFMFMVFSFDVFLENIGFWHKAGGFLIHNIFAFILLGVLYIGWKHENYAGFILLGLSVFLIFFFGPTGIQIGTWIMICLPLLAGLLFLSNYYFIK